MASSLATLVEALRSLLVAELSEGDNGLSPLGEGGLEATTSLYVRDVITTPESGSDPLAESTTLVGKGTGLVRDGGIS